MTTSGGSRNSTPGTLNQLFFSAIERYNKPDALQVKVGGVYQPISHQRLAERARRTAIGLQTLGMRKGDRVAILSENRPEWAIADYGCLTGGLTDVAIYPNLPPDQVAYILRDSGSSAIFVSTDAQDGVNAMKFLDTVADPKTSLEFNKVKGSVPVRNDVDVASLPAYQRQASNSLWHDKVLLSITHGELMPTAFQQGVYDAVATFVQSKNDNAFIDTLQNSVVVPISGR